MPVFDVSIVAITFGVIFVTELPDKTAVAVLVLATRYRAGSVFAGIAAAFAVHVVLAITAGSLLALLPNRWLQAASGVLFLVGAGILLGSKRQATEEHVGPPGDQCFWKAASAGFMLICAVEVDHTHGDRGTDGLQPVPGGRRLTSAQKMVSPAA